MRKNPRLQIRGRTWESIEEIKKDIDLIKGYDNFQFNDQVIRKALSFYIAKNKISPRQSKSLRDDKQLQNQIEYDKHNDMKREIHKWSEINSSIMLMLSDVLIDLTHIKHFCDSVSRGWKTYEFDKDKIKELKTITLMQLYEYRQKLLYKMHRERLKQRDIKEVSFKELDKLEKKIHMGHGVWM